MLYVYILEMKWNAAIGLLAQCEKEMRQLVAQAAKEGDYVSVLRITDMAKALAALTAEGDVPALSESVGISGIEPSET